MWRTTRLIGQQNWTAGTKIKVVVIEFLLVERSEPVDNLEAAVGRLQLQCSIAEIASSVRDIEAAIGHQDVDVSCAVRRRPSASVPDTAADAVSSRCVSDGLLKTDSIEPQQPPIEWIEVAMRSESNIYSPVEQE